MMMVLAFVTEMLVVRHYGLAMIFVTPLTILLAEATQLGHETPAALLQARLFDTLLGSVVGLLGIGGQALITQGEVGDWMLLLLEGTVDVVKRSEQTGESSRLAVVKEGASIGEMSMLDSAPRYASCIAIEDVRAGVLTRATIADLIHAHPAIGAKILVKLTQLLAQRLRNTSNRLVKVLQHQAPDYTPD